MLGETIARAVPGTSRRDRIVSFSEGTLEGGTVGTYVMLGRYSRDAVRGASTARTGEATMLLEKCGGQIRSAYALLGRTDLMLIADFPGTEEAMRASVELAKLTGIAFTTSPAVAISEFDKLFE